MISRHENARVRAGSQPSRRPRLHVAFLGAFSCPGVPQASSLLKRGDRLRTPRKTCRAIVPKASLGLSERPQAKFLSVPNQECKKVFTSPVNQRAIRSMPASHRKLGVEFSKSWLYQTMCFDAALISDRYWDQAEQILSRRDPRENTDLIT